MASIATCPLDVVKTKLQAQRKVQGQQGYQGVLGTLFQPYSSPSSSPLSSPETPQQTSSNPPLGTMAYVVCTAVSAPQFWGTFRHGPSILRFMTG